ncbi:MAG: PH domain-containing protein [Actinomycetaceae bacterium]|nr:PH domain-containing protein [Actinomycetaceae bacterium]
MPISDAYAKVLRVRALIRGLASAAVCAGLALWLRNSWWLWVVLAVLVIAVGYYGMSLWLSLRRARAIGYIEQEDDLLICGGLLVRHLTVVPYGRMQQVTVESGPIMRRFGLATVTMETASPYTNATIPGLEVAEAERVRIRLTELGNAMREGL